MSCREFFTFPSEPLSDVDKCSDEIILCRLNEFNKPQTEMKAAACREDHNLWEDHDAAHRSTAPLAVGLQIYVNINVQRPIHLVHPCVCSWVGLLAKHLVNNWTDLNKMVWKIMLKMSDHCIHLRDL